MSPRERLRLQQEEYRAAVLGCATVAAMLRQYDLPEILRAIEHAHAVGPILDPTLYRAKHEAMDLDAELLRAALPLWRKGRELEKAEHRDGARSTAPGVPAPQRQEAEAGGGAGDSPTPLPNDEEGA